jgi:hypothetical protein
VQLFISIYTYILIYVCTDSSDTLLPFVLAGKGFFVCILRVIRCSWITLIFGVGLYVYLCTVLNIGRLLLTVVNSHFIFFILLAFNWFSSSFFCLPFRCSMFYVFEIHTYEDLSTYN